MDGVPRLWPFLPPRVFFFGQISACAKYVKRLCCLRSKFLGKTANDAVLKNDTVNYDSNENDDDDTSDDESCGSNDEAECLYEDEQPQDVHILLQRIQL